MKSDFTRLMELFQKVEKPQRTTRETFMDIAGYPNYENVASNILKFFIEDREHGLGDLWIRSLLECHGNIPNGADGILVESVEREVVTDKGNRIDLLVKANNYIIVIENKIFHILNNDLKDYSDTASKNLSDGQSIINIVLSYYDVSKELDVKKYNKVPLLANVTYNALFTKVREHIGEYMENADNTWLIYMKDFMSTIENLMGGNSKMNEEFAKFVAENSEDINSLMWQMKEYRKDLRKYTDNLRAVINEYEPLQKYLDGKKTSIFNYNSGEYLYSCVCVDITGSNNQTVTIEIFPNADGWHMCMFRRNIKSGKSQILSFLKEHNISYKENTNVSNHDMVEIYCCPLGLESETLLKVCEQIATLGINTAEGIINTLS